VTEDDQALDLTISTVEAGIAAVCTDAVFDSEVAPLDLHLDSVACEEQDAVAG
jgi:hypothetical protein